ncbi:MAG: prenyltransferase [Candidatus Aminicenantes bacterium]|nr:prenyltransferase [Candidatus Aminicenantes bacterium]
MEETQNESVPFLKKWLTAMRPWALPASTMPVIFGTSLAVVIGQVSLDVLKFIMALLAMMILHSAANILSDVFDFKRGLDNSVTPVSGAIVRGWITTDQAGLFSVILFAVGSAIGLGLVLVTGMTLLIIGIIGVFIGVFYAGLKYHALGDLAVFLNFGILGSLGAWVVQTKSFSWIPIIWTVSMSMLVSGILHANNWRDASSDTERKVKTVASLLGDKGSSVYYAFLIFGPFVIVMGLILVPRLISSQLTAMPWTFFIVLLGLPSALKLWGRAVRRHTPRQPMDFIILDGATAQHNLVFGLLCTGAVWLQFILKLK